MKRLIAAIRHDIQLQVRNGFYTATAFVVVVWAVLLSQLKGGSIRLNLQWLLPALVSVNIVLTTFYFVGGLVLLEKAEGSLQAQVVTPLRTWEYLAAKLSTLALLALIENLIVAGLFSGLEFGVLPLSAGIILTSALYVLAGFVVVARYDSINEYLLPSVMYTSLLSLPVVPFLGRWEHWLLYLHPLQAPLVLMQAAFEAVETWQVVYGVLYAILWIGLMYRFSQHAFLHFIVGRAGAG